MLRYISQTASNPYQIDLCLACVSGRHRCIGENFAYVQIKTIWSTMLRMYDFDLVDGYFPTINYTTMIHTPHNPIIRYKRRKQWETEGGRWQSRSKDRRKQSRLKWIFNFLGLWVKEILDEHTVLCLSLYFCASFILNLKSNSFSENRQYFRYLCFQSKIHLCDSDLNTDAHIHNVNP